MWRLLHGPREADEGNVVGLHPLLPPRPPQVLDPALNLVLLVLDDVFWRNLKDDFKCYFIAAYTLQTAYKVAICTRANEIYLTSTFTQRIYSLQ